MRITTGMMASRSIAAINRSYELMNKYQTQLETQKKINRPSDDPVVAMKGVKNRADLAGIGQYIRNDTEADTWVDATDTAYDEAKKILQRLRELADNMANGTNTAVDREAAAKEISQLQQQMVDIANTQIAGNYIFNGTDIDVKPFTLNADGTVTFHQGGGSFDAVRVEVSRAGEFDSMLDVNSLPSAFFVPENSAGSRSEWDVIRANGVTAAGTIEFTVNGKTFNVELAVGDSTKTIMSKINQGAVENGVSPIAKLGTDANGDEILVLTAYTNNPAGNNMTMTFSGGLTIDGIGNTEPAVTNYQYDPDNGQPGLAQPTVFESINDLLNYVNGTQDNGEYFTSNALSHWLQTADQLIDRANLAVAEVGGKQNRLELITTRNDSTELFITKMLSENEDVDIEEVIMNLSIQESMHRASLAVSARVIQPSLLDFLS